MKVQIDCDKRLKQRGGTEYEGGWYYDKNGPRFATLAEVRAAATGAGHKIDNAGWKHKLLMWNWHNHSFDGYTGWELEGGHPAWCKLEHVNKKTKGSDELCQRMGRPRDRRLLPARDYSYDGSPCVGEGEAYGSGWWFATIAERDRFIEWAHKQDVKIVCERGE